MSDDTALSLVEMRFHVPQSNVFPAQDETGENADQESAGPDPVKELHDKILARADVIQATGDAIVTFSEIHCLTPRYSKHTYMFIYVSTLMQALPCTYIHVLWFNLHTKKPEWPFLAMHSALYGSFASFLVSSYRESPSFMLG